MRGFVGVEYLARGHSCVAGSQVIREGTEHCGVSATVSVAGAERFRRGHNGQLRAVARIAGGLRGTSVGRLIRWAVNDGRGGARARAGCGSCVLGGRVPSGGLARATCARGKERQGVRRRLRGGCVGRGSVGRPCPGAPSKQ